MGTGRTRMAGERKPGGIEPSARGDESGDGDGARGEAVSRGAGLRHSAVQRTRQGAARGPQHFALLTLPWLPHSA